MLLTLLLLRAAIVVLLGLGAVVSLVIDDLTLSVLFVSGVLPGFGGLTSLLHAGFYLLAFTKLVIL